MPMNEWMNIYIEVYREVRFKIRKVGACLQGLRGDTEKARSPRALNPDLWNVIKILSPDPGDYAGMYGFKRSEIHGGAWLFRAFNNKTLNVTLELQREPMQGWPWTTLKHCPVNHSGFYKTSRGRRLYERVNKGSTSTTKHVPNVGVWRLELSISVYDTYPALGRQWGTRRCTEDRPRVLCCCPAASRPPSAADRSGAPTWWSRGIGTAAPTRQCGHPRLWRNTPSNSCATQG